MSSRRFDWNFSFAKTSRHLDTIMYTYNTPYVHAQYTIRKEGIVFLSHRVPFSGFLGWGQTAVVQQLYIYIYTYDRFSIIPTQFDLNGSTCASDDSYSSIDPVRDAVCVQIIYILNIRTPRIMRVWSLNIVCIPNGIEKCAGK